MRQPSVNLLIQLTFFCGRGKRSRGKRSRGRERRQTVEHGFELLNLLGLENDRLNGDPGRQGENLGRLLCSALQRELPGAGRKRGCREKEGDGESHDIVLSPVVSEIPVAFLTKIAKWVGVVVGRLVRVTL